MSSFVNMVLIQKDLEDNPPPLPERPQKRKGNQGIYSYIRICPDTGVEMASYSSLSDAAARATGKLGANVHAAAVNVACKHPVGQKRSGGWCWRRQLK